MSLRFNGGETVSLCDSGSDGRCDLGGLGRLVGGLGGEDVGKSTREGLSVSLSLVGHVLRVGDVLTLVVREFFEETGDNDVSEGSAAMEGETGTYPVDSSTSTSAIWSCARVRRCGWRSRRMTAAVCWMMATLKMIPRS